MRLLLEFALTKSFIGVLETNDRFTNHHSPLSHADEKDRTFEKRYISYIGTVEVPMNHRVKVLAMVGTVP